MDPHRSGLAKKKKKKKKKKFLNDQAIDSHSSPTITRYSKRVFPWDTIISGGKEEWHLCLIQIFYYMLAKLACSKINILFPIFIFIIS